MSRAGATTPSEVGVEGPGVHFLTRTDPAEMAGWDPDAEPGRFVSGAGHAFLEPYARLRARGRPVTVGPHPPRHAKTLVVWANHLVGWAGHRRRRESLTVDLAVLRVPRVVVVLGDHPWADRVPAFVRAVIVPNPSGVVDDRTRWLPLPPQRAMVPRRADRRGRIRTLALKTGTPNVPDEMRAPEFAAAVADLGVGFRLDEHSPEWPDFADVDLVLCTRRARPEWDADEAFARKPPTKLINAWVAGCVPLVYPEVSHLDLVQPGVDALVVRSPDEVVDAVKTLQSDPALLARLEQGAAARGKEFSTDRVLERWERGLWGGDHAVTSRAAVVADVLAVAVDAARHRLPRSRSAAEAAR